MTPQEYLNRTEEIDNGLQKIYKELSKINFSVNDIEAALENEDNKPDNVVATTVSYNKKNIRRCSLEVISQLNELAQKMTKLVIEDID